NPSHHDESWEEQLRAGLGEPPQPDFEAWKAQHADALAALGDVAPLPANPWRTFAQKQWKYLAASLCFAAGLYFLFSAGKRDATSAAAGIPSVENAKTLTWTTTVYSRATSRDGSKTWIPSERRLHAYRQPGLYRETVLDREGRPRSVTITDVRAGQ